MSRPSLQTNPQIVEETIRAIGPWFEVHAEALALELGDDFDGIETAQSVSEALRVAQSDFAREQLEDKDLTTDREMLLVQIQTFVRSLRASVERRLMNQGPKEAARVLRDFTRLAPSHIRSVKVARAQLSGLSNALEVHKDMMRVGGRNRTRQWQSTINRLDEDLKGLSLRLGKERRETASAREARNKAMQEAMAFLQDMHLSAQAVAIDSQAPLDGLEVIFNTFNPSTTPRNTPSPSETTPVDPVQDP